MSATILRSRDSRQEAYPQPVPSRLLERRSTPHHANLPSLTNTTPAGQSTQINRDYDEYDGDDHHRSSTPCLDYIKSFAKTQSGNVQQIHSEVDPSYVAGRRKRDILAQKAFYTTSTQKLYDGVDWPSRIIPSPPPPETTKEPCADMVSFRNESKRYEPRSALWQKFGGRPFSWDYVQLRDGHHIPGPIQFCSPSKKIVHIPGYMGHVTDGRDEMDNPSSFFPPQNKLRMLQPRYSDTARKANIPGYTGCVLYCDYQPACGNDPDHLRSTASKTYRTHDEVLCNNRCPFKKKSAMSGMVTLTHPFNPFNKVH